MSSHELVDVRRKATLLEFFLHLLEHEDPLVRRRMCTEQLIGPAPVALLLDLDRLLQFVGIDLAVFVQVVGAHLLIQLVVVRGGSDGITDHERPRTARISSWFSCWRSACVTTSSEDETVRPKTNAFGEESPLTQI